MHEWHSMHSTAAAELPKKELIELPKSQVCTTNLSTQKIFQTFSDKLAKTLTQPSLH